MNIHPILRYNMKKKVLIYLFEREKETIGEIFHPLVCSHISTVTWLRLGTVNSNPVSHMAGNNPAESAPLSSKACIGRKLESKVRTKLSYSNVECKRYLNQWLRLVKMMS